jgi:hypothetical protein
VPDAANSVALRGPDGEALNVPVDQAADLLTRGYSVESGFQGAERVGAEAQHEVYGGIGGKIQAGAAGLARGATLGLSDQALAAFGEGDTLRKLRAENPYTSIGAEILGTLATQEFLPAGALAKAGSGITKLGEGAGIVGKTAFSAGGAALEGAGQSAGAYISQSALDNKPLSAEGFWGSVGSGGLVGGGIGGALAIGETALVKAKTLFPRSQVTREAAQETERAAASEIQAATSDGDNLLKTAREELAKNRMLVSASDAETAQKLNALKVQRAEQQLQRETAKTQRATEGPKRTRKVFSEEAKAPEVVTPGASGGPPPTVPPAQTASDDLLSQLQATKRELDAGADLGALSGSPRKVKSLDDEVDDLVAGKDPGHAKLLDATRDLDDAKDRMDAWLARYNKGGKYDSGEVSAFERGQATRDYAAGIRPKESGYYTKVPAGEGNALLPRGRQSVFRGSEEERTVFDAKTLSKLAPEERVAADQAASQLFKPRDVASEILGGGQATSVQDTIANALRTRVGEHANIGDDIAEGVDVIGNYERASANVADALGPLAPPGSQIRAEQYRNATAQHLDGSATNIADTAKAMDTVLPPDVRVPSKLKPAVDATKGGGGGELLKRAADVGTVLEVMSSLGLPGVPDLKNVPVIGPLLSLYLKARAASAVYRRLGGKLPATAEALVAKNAAKTQDRVVKAVDTMLDVGATGMRKARAAAGPMAALSTRLFNAGPAKTEQVRGKKPDAYQQYEQRMHELVTAQQPGVIAEAVRKSVPTGDTQLHAELVAAAERKLAFLNDKAPKKMVLPTLLKGDGEWKPSKQQLAQFSRYIEAAEDPAGVLEKLGTSGQVTYEAAETLRVVYPQLYKAAQMRLLERAPDIKEKLPYARRVSLSILFQVPVDGTMDATFVSFLRQGQPANSATPAQGSPAPAQPPTPTASGPVNVGERSMTRLDRRAGA